MKPLPATPSALPASRPPLTLQALSTCDQAAFTTHLGGVFEHSPWIAAAAWSARPFPSIDALHRAMTAAVADAGRDAQLALIRAHPELAGKEATAGTLTADSTDEQRSAGLDRCTAAELQRLRSLNAAYRERFGFPFVLAVKGRSKHDIIATLEARLGGDADGEFRTALAEIGKITRLRLDALLAS